MKFSLARRQLQREGRRDQLHVSPVQLVPQLLSGVEQVLRHRQLRHVTGKFASLRLAVQRLGLDQPLALALSRGGGGRATCALGSHPRY